MEHSEHLFTLAEVAVAFAGFASIVGILGQRAASSPDRLNALRMRIMLLHSLVVVAFSFVPSILYSYGIEQEMVWRASSGLYLVASVSVVVPLGLRLAALRAVERSIQPWVGYVAFPVIALEIILSIANTIGVTDPVEAGIYLTVLGLRLSLAGLAFVLLIFAFLSPSESNG